MFVQNDFHWRDVLSMNRGAHTIKTGVDTYYDQDNTIFTPGLLKPGFYFLNVFGFAADNPLYEYDFNYDPVTGGPPFNDYGTRVTTYGFFVQNDWKVKSNLSLNLGLRWDFSNNPTDKTDHFTNFELGPGTTMQERIAGIKSVHVSGLCADHRIGYFAPRLGLAWDPTKKGKMSVRAGFGVFMDRMPNQAWTGQIANPPNTANIFADRRNPNPPYPLFALGTSDEVPYNVPLPGPLPLGLNPGGGPLAGLARVQGLDPALRSAYAENWFLGVQYSFAPNWMFEANYMGSQGHHLYTQINRNRYAGDALDGTLDRLNPYFAAIDYTDNNGNSFYTSGSLAVRKVYSNGFSFQTAYTFGKAIDYSNWNSTGSSGIFAPVFDAWNYKAQRGLSETDTPQKLTFNFVWELPKPNTSSRIANGFLGGWEASSMATFQKGLAQGVYTYGADYNLGGQYYDRPDTPSWGNSKSGLSRSDYMSGVFTASDFPVPTPGTNGNLGRNTFRAPGYAQVDFGMIKNTHIPWFVSEGANFQIRAEFYNFLNRVNLATWDTNLASGTFGLATSAWTARRLQLGLRIQF
ncbi:MAG: TonB-dependent receptor [Acidobacteria bacterium]|nr:TonB-dependent receptor [Acidobacteriota bacterium]